ncbi:adenylyl cyclase [Deinococcus sp. D7000]|uniref:glycosyl hydrolase family 28-related protein n=1 Tax=Deinococcus radiopugnans TaxID=57497 RepID=UPI0009DEC700|nr:glycosyl hydrolase family 28-related protein [Deinococcus radiopugnans]QLG10642.1 adenylyl cyclase [Deinococcus sp. D7000]
MHRTLRATAHPWTTRPPGPRRHLPALLGLSVLLAACAPPAPVPEPQPENRSLGENVKVFDPSMPTSEIQAAVDAVKTQQVNAEFGGGRYALMFKPGTYGTPDKPLFIDVGYYTEVIGLGRTPGDVVINGHVNVYNRCLDTGTDGQPSNCIALNNFWRSASNLTVKVAGGEGCQAATNFWAVSQAAPMRRVHVDGKFSLMDYCSAGPQFASGGYIADSRFSGTDAVINGSQQQFIVRNSEIPGWSNGVWNQVFSGVKGAPATSFATLDGDGKPANPYTTLPITPMSREKPYLYLDAAGEYQVFVPGVKTNSSGVSWASGPESGGKTLPLSGFFIARPGDQVSILNAALGAGRSVLFTPGVYDIDQTLLVNKPGTVLLGLGLATLTAQGGAVPVKVGDVSGVSVAGLTIDAGATNSPVLLQVGTPGGAGGSASDPVALHDVFFRIGGPGVGKATTSLIVNSDHTILDHIWAWRADHGQGVGWTVNTADHGVIVNGDDVTATGLFVEHYQKDQLIWNGERGQVVLFQNEMPYDAPSQAAWQHDGILGYAAYKVDDAVTTHQAWGLGSYIFINSGADIHATHAFEVPVRAGVRLNSLLTVQLNVGLGVIDHVVNMTGPATIPPAGQTEGSTVISLKQFPE